MNNQLCLKGFVHNVTPMTQSRTGSSHYFNFSLQTSETRKRRAVCYDAEKQKLLKTYQQSKEPVNVLNITERPSLFDPSEQHVIVSKRSRIESVNKDDILFQYDNSTTQEDQPVLTNIENIQALDVNQLLTVKGTVTLRADSIREVVMRDGFLLPMLNRATITDNTCTIPVTLWGDVIQQVSNNKSYSITHVRIKQYDSSKYVTTTPSTTITLIEEDFPHPTKEFFDSLFDAKTIFVDKIVLADTLKTWLCCSKCQHLLTEATTTDILKCANCNAVQPVSSCSTNASVHIAVRDSKYEIIWFKAFTSVLQEMLNKPCTGVTLQSSEEEVYQQLFKLKMFTMQYSDASNIIKSIHFDPSN